MKLRIYKSGIHLGEEGLVQGNASSGMINFSGCHLSCSFCYTPETSVRNLGTDYSNEAFLELVDELVARGARNLNLISPTHLWPQLTRPLLSVRLKYGRLLPVVVKVSGYESQQTSKSIASFADVLVPDFKVGSVEAARSVNLPDNYMTVAQASIEQYQHTHGASHFSQGYLSHGILVRHLMMPGYFQDSLNVIRLLGETGYTGYLNLLTYFINPKKRTIVNTNPRDLQLAVAAAEHNEMTVLVNGKPYQAVTTEVHHVG